jgi:hypothetical protein
MTRNWAGLACSVPSAAFGLSARFVFLGVCGTTGSRALPGRARSGARGWPRRVAGGGVDELHRSLVGSRPLRERLRCLRMTAAADRNPMGLRVVESHPSQSTRRMGHPGLSQNQGQDQSQRQRTGVSVPHEPWRGQRVPHRAFSPVRNDKDLE